MGKLRAAREDNSRRIIRPLAAGVAALLAGGLAAVSVPVVANAAPTQSGSATSLPYTQGKGVGSGKWGVVGDIRTYEGTTTFTYGADINPVTGSLTVSDSGKVIYNSLLCTLLGLTAPCQQGTPSIADYALLGGDPTQIGSTDLSATEYTGAGTYAVSGAPASSRTRNTGIGKLYAAYSARKNITLPSNVQNGPRGIAHTADGVAWIVNSEAVAPVGGPAGVIKRYDTGMGELPGAGWTGTWAQRDLPGVHFYPTGIDTTTDGGIAVESETSDRIQRYDVDGTWLGSTLLDLPGPVYRNPYGVAIDKVDGSVYVPLVNFQDEPATTPFLEKRNAANQVIGQFTSSALNTGQVIMAAEVEPRTQHVFAWSQNGSVVEWDKEGNEVQVFRAGTTPGLFPGMTSPRGLTFDANGRMYVTVAEGTGNTRVMILGKTPDPVTSVCTTLSADKTAARVEIDCTSGPEGAAAPYQQTQLLDYVIEASTDGGTTWQVLPKDSGVSAAREQSVSGLDPAANYIFRVSPWNEAGNGDWITSTPVDYASVDSHFDTSEGTAVTFDPFVGDTGTDVPTGVGLVDENGDVQSSLTVAGEGEYVVGSDLTITFTPEPGFSGDVTPVTLAVLFDGCELDKTVTGTVRAQSRLTLAAMVNGGPLSIADAELSAGGPTAVGPGVSGEPAVTAVAVQAGVYTLEGAALSGYSSTEWSCVVTGTSTQVPVTSAAVTIADGQDVTCSIVYDYATARLTLQATLSGGPLTAADAELSAAGPTAVGPGATGDASVTAVVVGVGDYALTAGALPGYSVTAWSCVLTGTSTPVPLTADLTLEEDQDVTCSIEYEFETARLTLRATVNGGALTTGDVQLSAAGATAVGPGVTGDASVAAVVVDPDEYALSAASLTGYTVSDWSCVLTGTSTDVPVTSQNVTVLGAQDVTCSIAYDVIKPTLTLQATVSGGSLTTGDVQLSAAGPTFVGPGRTGDDSITGVAVDTGDYTLSASALAGYTASEWSCVLTGTSTTVNDEEAVALGAADVVVCSIVYTAIAPKLTLHASVNGGSSTAADALLSAAGPVAVGPGATGDDAVTSVSVEIGSYVLSASALTGYDSTAWSCVLTGTSTVASVTDGAVSLSEGQDVTCAIAYTFTDAGNPGGVDPGAPGDTGTPSGGAGLATTGQSVPVVMIVLALGLLLAGGATFAVRRARRS